MKNDVMDIVNFIPMKNKWYTLKQKFPMKYINNRKGNSTKSNKLNKIEIIYVVLDDGIFDTQPVSPT